MLVHLWDQLLASALVHVWETLSGIRLVLEKAKLMEQMMEHVLGTVWDNERVMLKVQQSVQVWVSWLEHRMELVKVL